jgi:thiosulfate/3-mercaptopyruvate sulfurtransferase
MPQRVSFWVIPMPDSRMTATIPSSEPGARFSPNSVMPGCPRLGQVQKITFSSAGFQVLSFPRHSAESIIHTNSLYCPHPARQRTTVIVCKSLFPILLVVLSLPLRALAAPINWSPLLEPAELADILAQTTELRIIQVTGNFNRGHLPGALESPYSHWRGPARSPGELPPLESLTANLQSLGITAQIPVVVIHEGANPADMGAATRVYWTLKSLGIINIAVLNGGLNAWRDAGLPISTESIAIPASIYAPQWLEQWRIDTETLEQMLDSGDSQLIDARPPLFFAGFRATVGRAGTIRGAQNLPYESWFDGPSLKAIDELQTIFSKHPFASSPALVSFCNTGHWASINWFVMSELLGLTNVRLYAESVAEWSQADRPMDNQPNRSQIYRDMTVRWLKDLLGS